MKKLLPEKKIVFIPLLKNCKDMDENKHESLSNFTLKPKLK